MGANKEYYSEISQQEQINPMLVQEQEKPSDLDILMDKLRKKELRLSYSSLKQFGKSPREFIKYKLQENKPQSDSQIFGSVCDVLLTEPEKFELKFSVTENIPTTDNQKLFCQDVINGISVEDAFSNNYKRGKAEDLYNSFESYIKAMGSGKTVITKEIKEEAQAIVDNLKKSDLIMSYVDACDSFQAKTEWEYNGWKFLGFKDAEGKDLIIDFKYSRDANPDKFERDIINFEYYLQMGMYADSCEGIPECYFIVYDKSMNFSLIKLDYTLINYGIRKYRYLVQKLEQCIEENRFNESYNFFDVQQRTVYKPKWIKGFETDVD